MTIRPGTKNSTRGLHSRFLSCPTMFQGIKSYQPLRHPPTATRQNHAMAHPRLHRSSVEKTNENASFPFMVSSGILPLFVQHGLQWRKGIKKHWNSGCAKAYFHIIFRNGPENRPDRQSTRPSETDFSKKNLSLPSSRLFFFPHPGKQTPGRSSLTSRQRHWTTRQAKRRDCAPRPARCPRPDGRPIRR